MVTLTAGGVDTRSTWLNGQFANLDGTSMATPLAASVGCLWMGQVGLNMPANADRCKAFLKAVTESCDSFPSRTTTRGFGRPNAVKVIGTGNPPPPPPTVTPITLSDNDLTADARTKLKAAGIGAFTLTVTPVAATAPAAPATTAAPVPTVSTQVPSEAAPVGKRWVKDGPIDSAAPWRLEDAPVPAPMAMPQAVPQAMPVGLPLIRQQFQQTYQRCFGPNCPK